MHAALIVLAGLVAVTTSAHAQAAGQSSTDAKPRIEIYGHVMTDMGYDFNQNNPNWFDVVRPTKLPSVPNEFGRDGRFYSGVRQSRFGVKTYTPTDLGELRTTFEYELFGTGVDEGQTTFRLRHAYGELGQFGAGQYWSPFMDIDVFPNSLEYWGPNGMVFFRNVQFRWMPIQGDTRLTLAIERPGASADAGRLEDRIELQNVLGRFPMPDVSGEYRFGRDWGYVEVAGIVRRFDIDDLLQDEFDLEQTIWGWGVNLSSNLKPTDADTIRLQLVYGEGVENYMNDAPVDVGIELNPGGGPRRPIRGAALPLLGIVAFLDHNWNDQWSSSGGYSFLDIDNTNGQNPSAFSEGHYALVNLLHYPVKNVLVGGEFQYGRRVNFSDGFRVNDFRIQFSFKYNFLFSLGGQ
ncbi:MAG: hypothetical protein EHM55_18330 [Acidobacteria bacterium]|nr:MAG: hypothetical protein EHM55_18330 [Acidobacteriota bacterium]